MSNAIIKIRRGSDKDRILAFADFETVGDASVAKTFDSKHYWITRLYVKPSYRGGGLASRLIKTVLSTYTDRPICVRPYGFSDFPKTDEELYDMYKHFGFKEIPGQAKYLIYNSLISERYMAPTLIIQREGKTSFYELVGGGYRERCYIRNRGSTLVIPHHPDSLSWGAAESRVRKGRKTYTIFFLSKPLREVLPDYGFDIGDYFFAALDQKR